MPNTYGQSYWEEVAARNGGDTSLLVAQFRSFYEEVARLRSAVQSETPPDSVAARVSDMQQQLLRLFETHEQRIQRVGGEQLRDRYRRARYLMTALADELFLDFDWYGQNYWYDHLLELQLYDSQNSGERIFAMIDDLLQGGRVQQLDLAKLYLFALVLGFEGKFRDADDPAPLEDYKARLYRFIEREKPGQLEEGGPLLQEAYRHTLDRGEGELLPNFRWWLTSLGLTFVVYLVLSTLIWWYFTTDMVSLAQDILAV